jgi:hypothetical protein
MPTQSNETFLLADNPEPTKQPRTNSSQLEKLLNWLVHHWTRPTISAAEIYTYGPWFIRGDRNRVIELAKILVTHGWLTPLKTHRHDSQRWQIARGPTPLMLFLPAT